MSGLKDIRVYDKLITNSMAEQAMETIMSKGFQYGWQSSAGVPFGHWNLGFSSAGEFLNNRKDVAHDLPDSIKKIWEFIHPVVFGKNRVLVRSYCNAHTYGTEGYVHRDSPVPSDLTAIVYLNRKWNPDWAGETALLEKGEIIKSVLPKWKRILVFPSNMPHVARAVSRYCPEARIVLVFKTRLIKPR